jgi:resuscitation-promoting factor RpfB
LVKGVIGGDPKLIPWRTNLYVPEYGLGVMGDTGGARRSRYWIDLGYSDEDYVSWHRYTEIYLLTPVPEEIPYLLPTWAAP